MQLRNSWTCVNGRAFHALSFSIFCSFNRVTEAMKKLSPKNEYLLFQTNNFSAFSMS